MDDKDMRQGKDKCTKGAQTGPQTIIVRQVVGQQEAQKVLDIHAIVPDAKPAIEQIIDVFVKNVEVNSVNVITDKVIVRGDFEIKAIYVACLPDQPVHAMEIKNYKWSQDIPIQGARRGMDAEATVTVEFVDYDVSDLSRAYKYKYQDPCDCEEEEEEEPCEATESVAQAMPSCPTESAAVTPPPAPTCPATESAAAAPMPCDANREFDISVVLKMTAKVMTDREVQLGAQQAPMPPMPQMPTKPKG